MDHPLLQRRNKTSRDGSSQSTERSHSSSASSDRHSWRRWWPPTRSKIFGKRKQCQEDGDPSTLCRDASKHGQAWSASVKARGNITQGTITHHARSVLPESDASLPVENKTVKRRRSLGDMIGSHLHLYDGLRRNKSRNELQIDQKHGNSVLQVPHCPAPEPLVIKPSGSLDLEFANHSTALSPKVILHKTSRVGPSVAEKAVQFTAQTPYVRHQENDEKTDDVVASELKDKTDLSSREPAIVIKSSTLPEPDRESPAGASDLVEQFDELSDDVVEEPRAVPVGSQDDKRATASTLTDWLDDNASITSLPSSAVAESTAGVLTQIGAHRPEDYHLEYDVDTETGQVCVVKVPGPPEPWDISKELACSLLATGPPEPGSKDAQAWDEYVQKLREKKGLVAIPNASSLRTTASNQLSRKPSIHKQQGRLRTAYSRHPPKGHTNQ